CSLWPFPISRLPPSSNARISLCFRLSRVRCDQLHSFVLIAGRPTEDAERTARRALTSVQGQIELGASLQIEMLPLRGFAGALATLSPKPDYTPPLFDLAASEARTVFCLGRVTGTARAARALLEVIESEG